ADLDDIAAHNCTYVVHCFTETDLTWNRGTIERIFRATRDVGLEVWADPWGVAGIFSGETLSRFVAEHPEAWQELSDGRRVPASCPSHPETRRLVGSWIDAAAEAGAQVAFWDEPHLHAAVGRGDYSGAWSCHCVHCREIFSRAGGTLSTEFGAEMQAFRELVLIDFLTEMVAESRRAGMRNALCLLPSSFEAHGFPEVVEGMKGRLRGRVPDERIDQVLAPVLHFGIDDWSKAAAIPGLDIFGTDPYWFLFDVEPEHFMRAFSERAIETAHGNGRESQLWLQAFAVPEGREEELLMGAQVASQLGADSLAAWSYRGTASMSKIASARPEIVWEVVGRAFADVRGQRR
ncbi:MAG TPA: hypothetical protein VFZ12_06655, partial [Dehalococcoidia bacterium]|nr:hypothetical protein [Dehalococcoidia bacterium]